MGRPARGVRGDGPGGRRLPGRHGDRRASEGLILSISENGYGKRTPLKDYRLTARGGKGVINMKTTPRIGNVVAVMAVKEDTDLMIITKEGKIIRIESSEIRQAGRSTQGVRLVRMEDGDRVGGGVRHPRGSQRERQRSQRRRQENCRCNGAVLPRPGMPRLTASSFSDYN